MSFVQAVDIPMPPFFFSVYRKPFSPLDKVFYQLEHSMWGSKYTMHVKLYVHLPEYLVYDEIKITLRDPNICPIAAYLYLNGEGLLSVGVRDFKVYHFCE